MDKTYDTIVIGSGCGGSAAAALMANLGHKTLLIEKNKLVGGRAALFERDGFKLDHGHIIARCNKGPHGDVLKIAGCKDLIPKYSYAGNWPVQAYLGDRLLDIYPSFRKMLLSGRLGKLRKSIDLTFREILVNAMVSGKECLMTERQIKKYDNVALKTKMSQHKNNPYINAFLEGFSVGIFGAPAWEASAGEMIRIFRNVFRDLGTVGYPVNGEGVSAIPKSFIRAAERLGSDVVTGTPVQKIMIEGGRVTGVLVDGEKIFAKNVISNAGLRPTVTKLVGKEHFSKGYVNRIENLKYSCSGLSFKFALKKKITDYVWGGEIPMDVENSYLGMTEGKAPDKFIVMFFATSNIDPSLAPPGCQTISCISGGPLVEPGTFDWSPWMEKIKNQLERLLPGLSENTLFCREETPDHIARFNGRFYGDAVGAAQTIDQMGHLRPSMVSPVSGLYYVGADVGWGSMATEAATASAIYLHDYFKKNHTQN